MRQSMSRNAELGVIQLLLDRFITDRLPYACELKTKVDRGEALSEHDMSFLKKVLAENAHARRLAQKHAKYESLVNQATSLYEEILRKAVDARAASKHAAARE